MSFFDLILKYKEAFANGIFVTLQLCLIIWSVGIILGTLLGVAGSRWNKWVGIPSWIISFTLSGTPILVLLFWLHYPMQAILGVVIDPFITASVTFSLVNIFAVSDSIRRVLRNFPSQYTNAAIVCGLSRRSTLYKIKFPIVFRQVIPNIIFIQVNMLQATLFASLISVNEIFRVAQNINSIVYRPVEIYSALAILFLLICIPLNILGYRLEKKYSWDLSDN